MNQQNPKTGFNQGGNPDPNFGGGGGFGAGGPSQFGGSQFGGSQFGGGAGGGAAGGGGAGEFSNAGFGGGTNAVSQIFKEGGFDDGKRKRTIFIVVGVLLVGVCGAAAWWLFSNDETDKEKHVEAPLAAAEAPATAGDDSADEAEDPAPAEAKASIPVAGADSSVAYDARRGGIVINATAGAVIEVSRSADFSGLYVRGVAKGGSFQIPLPPPGKIYWREQGGQQSHVVSISAPERASVQFSAPQKFQKGGSLTWTGSGPISYYRVEFATDKDFGNVVSAFATSQTNVTPGEVAAGSYFVRVGAFNAAAGQFQYSSAGNVTVE